MVLFHLLYDCQRTDLNFGNAVGETALALAAAAGNMEVVDLLVYSQPRCNINAQDNLGRTPLMTAALYGQDPVVRLLLAQPVLDWVKCDKEGRTIVEVAKMSPSFIVRRMIRGRARLMT